jgi:hypothetical protein
MSKVFYRAVLEAQEDGLIVMMQKFISIHETECIHFCVSERNLHWITSGVQANETKMQVAKDRKVKVYRIHKFGSRIAQPTEQDAFLRLQFLKRKQGGHLQRNLEMVKCFLEQTADKKLEDLEVSGRSYRIPESIHVVNEYFRFD